MAQGMIEKVVVWGLLLLFVAVFLFALFNPKLGLIQKISKLALKSEGFLPDQPSKEVKPNDEIEKEATTAQQAFMTGIKEQGKECIFRYSQFNLAEQKLEIKNYNNGIQTRIMKSAGKEETGSAFLNPMFNENMHLCVISPERFLEYAQNKEADSVSGTYNLLDVAVLTKDKIIINNIEYITDNIMFKPDANRICLVPFSDKLLELPGCKSREDSLDDGCIGKIQLGDC